MENEILDEHLETELNLMHTLLSKVVAESVCLDSTKDNSEHLSNLVNCSIGIVNCINALKYGYQNDETVDITFSLDDL